MGQMNEGHHTGPNVGGKNEGNGVKFVALNPALPLQSWTAGRSIHQSIRRNL